MNLQAGVAIRDLSPRKPLFLVGYPHMPRTSTGMHDALLASALFLSDGKDVYLYSPGENKAERSKLKESDDMRAPLAFLLGKLDFAKEFRSFEARAEGPDTWIVAEPKSANLVYSKVEFLAAESGEIRRVRVTGQDQSKLEFTFRNEQFNAPTAPGMFVFHAPPGVRVVEAEQ